MASFHSLPHPAHKQTIKLALEASGSEKDGPFVRVQVPNEVGPQLLEMLRGRALDLWAMNNDTASFKVDEAKVFLTYRDVENDLCFIFSDEDLRCALPLFPASLRVFARVEVPKRDEESIPGIKSSSTSTSTQTSNARSISDIPVHKVVESVVGVLAAATVALQKHVKVNPPSSPTTSSTSTMISDATSSTPKTSGNPTVCVKTAQKAANEEEDRPFIHGRHTCDGCLTTPILGKRFHAVNLPDYDLCAACHANYKGNEIIFEEAQLDRDVCLQERWNHRFSKWCQAKKEEAPVNKKLVKEERKQVKEERKAERKQARQEARRDARRSVSGDSCPPVPQPPPAPCAGFPPHCPLFGPPPPHAHHHVPPHGPPFGPPPHGPPFGPPPHAPPHVHPPHPWAWGPNGGRRCGGARHWNIHNPDHVDPALKEAIRRSLADFEHSKTASGEDGDSKTTAANDVEEPLIQEEEISVMPKDEKEMPEMEKEGAHETKTVVPSAPEEEFEIPPEAPVGAPPAPRPTEEFKEDEHVVIAEADKVGASATQDSTHSVHEDSFAEDAIGNGPVAEELGKVFDKFVTDINEFKTDIDGVRVNSVHGVDENSAASKSFGGVASGENSKEGGGATILQGEEEDNDSDVESQNSWDFVNAEQLSHDEALARATQVVGSALFESGLTPQSSDSQGSVSSESHSSVSSGSHGSVLDLVFGDENSCPASLPSVSSRSVQPVQLERWALQLTQLHELGFLDDEKNVEILERFHAANIGSDEMEEVSVERVVNELMKDF
ncbi:hypothetical protein ACA910_009254 [Epithemia clementina (nom. ined.)]